MMGEKVAYMLNGGNQNSIIKDKSVPACLIEFGCCQLEIMTLFLGFCVSPSANVFRSVCSLRPLLCATNNEFMTGASIKRDEMKERKHKMKER